MSALLETRGLGKKFGEVVAASNINVQIQPKEVIGVIGANGAGKTTFVNMVTGYMQPSEGEIFFRQEKVNGLPSRALTRRGMCRSFQIPQLFLDLTTLENIVIALTIIKQNNPSLLTPTITKPIVDESMALLSRFNIDQYANHKISALAQGVRKLVDIVMATAGNPKLLFLDEPTSGVSADEKMLLMEVLMNALRFTETAVLFIEHDMEIVENFAPRTIAFYEGTILADGETSIVLEDAEVRKYVIGSEFHRQGENTHA
ncbi:MAG: branched-chain amino acid transport system ATP-binding protein [Cellvibrionaceae bacterium]|jgi:branched-chain amino acid transport system ATP-binding protein